MEPLNETVTVNRLDYEALEASLAIVEEHAVRQERRIHDLEKALKRERESRPHDYCEACQLIVTGSPSAAKICPVCGEKLVLRTVVRYA